MLVAKTMAAPAPAAWELLADTAAWPAWGPTVAAVEPAAATVVPGLEGRVRTPVGAWLPFRITDVDPGRRWTWRVAGVQATSHRVDDLGDGRIRVGFEVPLWGAAYAVVCWAALRRIEAMLDASSAA